MDIKNLVKNDHKIHRRYWSYWDFLLQSYEGGLDYCNARVSLSSTSNNYLDQQWRLFINGIQQQTTTVYGNLFMHTKERPEDYNRRVAMSYFYNFCAPIVDIYGDHLFKQGVTEDFKEIKSDIELVRNDIDRQGSSITEFRRSMSDLAQIEGHCFVVIDSPSISKTEVLTLQDQIEKRAFPYLNLISPQNVLNWALDEFGFPYWVLIRETKDGNQDPTNYKEDDAQKCNYRLWTRNEWYLFDEDYSPIGAGTHHVGEVPIVCIVDKKSKKAKNFLGISQLADISFIARDIFNASSELRQILRDQTFAFLAIQGSSDEYAGIDLGTGKGLLYPEGRNAPAYVSPPADNASSYFNHIDRQVVKLYQLAKIDAGGIGGGQSKSMPASTGTVDGQSGVSKAWDFNQTNSSLSSKASSLEDGEMRIWGIFAKWLGKKFTGNIQYPNEFSISSLMDDLNEAETEGRVELGATFNIEVRKAIIKKKFPRKSDEDIQVMAKEVEDLFKNKQNNQGSSMAQRVAQIMNNGGSQKPTATGGQKQGAANV